ncbi:hypothetical protein LP417_13240 [Polaromonas sp. P1-6]|nr:hypothetical protein LP417_13240 [Polaromonas sp. P1-6]
MVGSEGVGDKYIGASGFDWATFKDEPFGTNIDLGVRAFNAAPVPVAAGIIAKFAAVEGLSGSAFGDVLQGDNADALVIATAGAQGSVLTNFDLINGLRAFLANSLGVPAATLTSFGAGNIILGGDGSDVIEGHGGDDLIDGDKWLNVRISVRANIDGTGAEIASFDSMKPMIPLMLNGTYNPGQLVLVREILTAAGPDFDTAVFTGNRLDYTVTINDNGTAADFSDDIVTVTDSVVGRDGTDHLTHIEHLRFADQSQILVPGLNSAAVGLLSLNDRTPAVGQVLTAGVDGPVDADNVTTIGGTISGAGSLLLAV